jgi:hypothetical protein
MFEAAHEAFERWGIGDITRIDVPGRASGEETDESGIRSPVSAAIPALQSGSLFGGATGVLIVERRCRTSATSLIRSISIRPQVGQAISSDEENQNEVHYFIVSLWRYLVEA